MTLSLTIPGPPVAQPRHRVSLAGGFPRSYLARVKDRVSGRRVEHPVIAYKERIAIEARRSGFVVVGPVSVAVRFFLPVPKRFKRWETDEGQRTLAIQSKPDVDNLAKAVLDALSGVAYADDAQVVRLRIEKWNALEPRTEIEVRPIQPSEKDSTR